MSEPAAPSAERLPLTSLPGLKAAYLEQAVDLAREGDVYPQPAIVVADDGGIEMFAIADHGGVVLETMRTRYRKGGVAGFAFGMDRTTKPGQGTARSSVVTWAVVYGDEVHVGIVDYDAGETVEAPSEEASPLWNERMRDNVRWIRGEPTTGEMG
jgi:hypothetical protein